MSDKTCKMLEEKFIPAFVRVVLLVGTGFARESLLWGVSVSNSIATLQGSTMLVSQRNLKGDKQGKTNNYHIQLILLQKVALFAFFVNQRQGKIISFCSFCLTLIKRCHFWTSNARILFWRFRRGPGSRVVEIFFAAIGWCFHGTIKINEIHHIKQLPCQLWGGRSEFGPSPITKTYYWLIQ